MAGWWRQPTLHFLAIGALLFACETMLAPSPGPAATAPEPVVVVVSAAQVAELRRSWLALTGRLPDASELESLVADTIDEEVLVGEARARGFHRSDPLVRRRLVRNLRFVSDDPERSDEDLFAEALALGLDRSDLVVRRRLIQKMKLGVRSAIAEPETDELEAFLASHAERFAQPARVGLSHVFVSRDRRGAGAEAEAQRLLARLRDESLGPAEARLLGDPFLHPRDLPARSLRELAGIFGEDFAREVALVEAGGWAGPLPSSYGIHLVWVHQRSPMRVPELASIRARVRDAWLTERAAAELAARLQRWRAGYAVAFEDAKS
jgi:hypothetical protein